MATYRKKPVLIDAFQWTGGPDQIEDPEWIEGMRTGAYHLSCSGAADGGHEQHLCVCDQGRTVGVLVLAGVGPVRCSHVHQAYLICGHLVDQEVATGAKVPVDQLTLVGRTGNA